MSSPFVFGKIATGKTFINRVNERKRVSENFLSGTNTMLISPRRWGKTSLIRKAADECSKNYPNIRFCFIDLFAIKSEHEFYEVLLTEILKASDTKFESLIKTAKEFLKQIVPIFSLNLDNESSFQLSIEWEQLKKNVSEILDLPDKIAEKRKIKFVICIDEFQKCTQFENSLQFQQQLRSAWQMQQNCSYVLYGSKRHVITQLFENQSMPFYRFGDLLYLNRIEKKYWLPYLQEQFSGTEKEISLHFASMLVSTVQNHPFYVQQLAHQLWIKTKTKVTQKIFDDALEELLLYTSVMYYKETDSLTSLQLSLLHAISDGHVQLTSKKVLNKYNLGTAGNILRIKEALEKKEIIDFFEKRPMFIDPLYEVWLKQNLFK